MRTEMAAVVYIGRFKTKSTNNSNTLKRRVLSLLLINSFYPGRRYEALHMYTIKNGFSVLSLIFTFAYAKLKHFLKSMS